LKKRSFLADLYEEEKIQFVNPSQDMKTAYLKKSESYLLSARLLRDHDQFEQSVSMAYYSMYYSVLALFFRTGIKCENHAAAIVLLRSVFDIDSSDIETAKRERIDKQYYVDTTTTRQDVDDLCRIAENFHAGILDFIERLTTEKIARFHDRCKKLVTP